MNYLHGGDDVETGVAHVITLECVVSELLAGPE